LEEKGNQVFENLRKRKQTIKTNFDKKAKSIVFEVDEKVLLWDSAHIEKGNHSKFQKLWLGPYKIAFVIGNNSYFLKYMEERLFSYTINGLHLKHYVELDVFD